MPSQSEDPATIIFYTLPSEVRNNIYERVLVVGHPLFLYQEAGSKIACFAPDKPYRWLALLYINRQISGEARAVLYGRNQFTLVDTTQRQVGLLESFLNSIGLANASLLSHLSINFPVAESTEGQPRKAKIREDSLRGFRLLQERCTSLKRLETFVHSHNSSLIKGGTDNDEFAQDAFSQIDAQLKAIPSLNTIIVRSYAGSPSSLAKDLIQRVGWIVRLGDEE